MAQGEGSQCHSLGDGENWKGLRKMCEVTLVNCTSYSLLEGGNLRTSLVVQCLRLHAPNAGDPSSIPGQGTRVHMQLKDPTCSTKTQCSQINKLLLLLFLKKEERS